MGVHNWVENMFHMIETGEVDEHSAHYINLAHEMIKRFSAVVFMKEKERLGKKASNLIRKVRTKHHIKEDEALEVTIDNTRAARKVYRDLLKITGIRDLPQIFVNETFIGSWQDLKTLNKTGMLSKELLSSIGFKDLFCPICAETGGKNHEAHKDRVKNF
ncbi:glutaredoxin-2, mitochondrial-like [Bolinopsis microptera]|uniref:glutaredoxin-2, mitochondrial-like n=1 Tax=Bolinopsis microptera TaxID=2820187 RepID=UPI00307A8FDC